MCMCRYYAGLSMMETRFPISKDRSHVHIAFKWYDAFRATRALEQSSIHFEKAAILFNLGAVLTQQALGCDLSSDSGVKEAAKKFQVIILLHSLITYPDLVLWCVDDRCPSSSYNLHKSRGCCLDLSAIVSRPNFPRPGSSTYLASSRHAESSVFMV